MRFAFAVLGLGFMLLGESAAVAASACTESAKPKMICVNAAVCRSCKLDSPFFVYGLGKCVSIQFLSQGF